MISLRFLEETFHGFSYWDGIRLEAEAKARHIAHKGIPTLRTISRSELACIGIKPSSKEK